MDKGKEELEDKLYSFLINEDYEGTIQFLETLKKKEKNYVLSH